jgi:hypothetical protein
MGKAFNANLKGEEVIFVLTELYPNLAIRKRRVEGRKHLKYVQSPVDATDAPSPDELLAGVVDLKGAKWRKGVPTVLRLFPPLRRPFGCQSSCKTPSIPPMASCALVKPSFHEHANEQAVLLGCSTVVLGIY